jgi:hypothetical protein
LPGAQVVVAVLVVGVVQAVLKLARTLVLPLESNTELPWALGALRVQMVVIKVGQEETLYLAP